MARKLQPNEQLYKAQNPHKLQSGDTTTVEAWLLEPALPNYRKLNPNNCVSFVNENEAIGIVISGLLERSQSGIAHLNKQGNRQFTLDRVIVDLEQKIEPLTVRVFVKNN